MHIPEAIKTYGIIILLIISSFWFFSRFIEPTPSKHLILAAGSIDGGYYKYAQLYKAALEEEGITVVVLQTSGSKDNIDLLNNGQADIAFVQSGVATDKDRDNIETLGSLYYEPLWIFSRNNYVSKEDLKNFNSKTLAIGPKGSGTNAIASQLLEINKLTDKVTLIEASGKEAVIGLQTNSIDAAFFVARSESSYIKELLSDPSVHLLPFERAQGYTKIFPFLSKVILNEGAIDMAENIPNKDIGLISPVAQLASRKGLNSALKTLLIDASMDIFNKASLFSVKGQFPTLDHADFPIAEEASRYFKYGPNFLQRVLPFWIADMISRMIVMLIPLLGIMLPLIKIASPTYRWRTRSKIYKWYKILKKIEDAKTKESYDLKETLDSLEKIDDEVKKTQVPLSYADELYNLRQHIKMIKKNLQ